MSYSSSPERSGSDERAVAEYTIKARILQFTVIAAAIALPDSYPSFFLLSLHSFPESTEMHVFRLRET
jgi:hypothetical protein